MSVFDLHKVALAPIIASPAVTDAFVLDGEICARMAKLTDPRGGKVCRVLPYCIFALMLILPTLYSRLLSLNRAPPAPCCDCAAPMMVSTGDVFAPMKGAYLHSLQLLNRIRVAVVEGQSARLIQVTDIVTYDDELSPLQVPHTLCTLLCRFVS